MHEGLPEADLAAIRQLIDTMTQALGNNDIETWLNGWTEDAVLMPPGVPSHKGHEQLKKMGQTVGDRKYTLSDMLIEGQEDLAVVTTALSIPRKSPGKGTDAGKQMLKLRKQSDGKWQLAALIFNFDVSTVL